MSGEELRRVYAEASNLKAAMMQDSNIGILLYLAKYNPKVTKKDISEKFGTESLKGLKALHESGLVKEDNGNLTLTDEGIFQVEGLLTISV